MFSSFSGKMTRKGLWRNIRKCVSLNEFYFICSETLECSHCSKSLAAWDMKIMEQLDMARRTLFHAVLTYQLALDRKVLVLMRQRGLGNSAAQVRAKVAECHSQSHMEAVLR